VKTLKYLGFAMVAVGVMVVLFAALLPVGFTSDRLDPFRFTNSHYSYGCGAAAYAALGHAGAGCQRLARARLLWTTSGGIISVLAGAVMVR